MPVFNYSDYSNELRDIVCSNPIMEVAANSAASNPVLTFPRIRNNSAYAMDTDVVRNTLEGMTQNAVFGDLAVLGERQFRAAAAMSHFDVLRKLSRDALLRELKEDRRREELAQIKILRSSKATIRYIMEVK